MQVSVEVVSGLKRRLSISVPSQEFEKQVGDRLLKAQKTIELRGFRLGKVPMKEVRRRFGPAMRSEVAEELVERCYVKALTQERLFPAGAPKFDIVKIEPEVDFEFTANVEVLPDIELADFGDIEVVRPEAEITDADVDQMAEKLRQQRRTWRPVDRPARSGDLVEASLNDGRDDETADRGDDRVKFVVGEGQAPESVDLAVLNMRAGETKALTPGRAVALPDHAEERRTESDLRLWGVEEAVLPELNEAFFISMGISEGGLADFRESVTANMRRELDARVQMQIKSQVLAELRKRHQVPLPESLVHEEILAIKARLASSSQLGRPIDASKLPDEQFRATAQATTANGLILRQIVREHHLEADADNVRAEIERVADAYREPEGIVRAIYRDKSQLATIEDKVIEAKAIDVVLASAQVKLQSSTYEDVMLNRVLTALESADAEAEQARSAAPAETSQGAALNRDGQNAD